jgi:predicted nucleic acid-binding protein
MIVIADTGPINYLILIGEIEVLPALYNRVLVPTSVSEELKRPRAPNPVRVWISQPPAWLEVRSPGSSPGAELAHLDVGERDAILLAEELGADRIIIDEIRGRREARRRHLSFTDHHVLFAGEVADHSVSGEVAAHLTTDSSFPWTAPTQPTEYS